MQLYYIRHAQSANNALYLETGGEIGRSEDPELTPIGLEQAKLAAQFLKTGSPRGGYHDSDQDPEGFGITHLYCSLMLRAVQTGTIISQGIGVKLQAWVDIHESGGIYLDDPTTGLPVGRPGKNRAFFQANFPNLILPEDLPAAGWWNNQPLEPAAERPIRAQRFLAELIARHGETNDRVAIISHGGFYNHLLKAILGIDSNQHAWFALNNACITRIDYRGEGLYELVYQNRNDFLPEDLVT